MWMQSGLGVDKSTKPQVRGLETVVCQDMVCLKQSGEPVPYVLVVGLVALAPSVLLCSLFKVAQGFDEGVYFCGV
jgi:hypothetical protein